jgi:hypothetical protein
MVQRSAHRRPLNSNFGYNVLQLPENQHENWPKDQLFDLRKEIYFKISVHQRLSGKYNKSELLCCSLSDSGSLSPYLDLQVENTGVEPVTSCMP